MTKRGLDDDVRLSDGTSEMFDVLTVGVPSI